MLVSNWYMLAFFVHPCPQAYVVFERPTKEQVQVLSRTFVTWIVTVNAGENELFLSSSQINMVHLDSFGMCLL